VFATLSAIPRWLGALLAVGAVAGGLGVTAAYWAGTLPSAAQQLPLHSTPVVVTLSRPLDGSSYPLNSHIPVEARAVGAGTLVALELWVDGALAERNELPAESRGPGPVAASWTWTPSQAGEHTLLARAVDADMAVAGSNSVRVSVGEEVVPLVLHTAAQGDTLESLARAGGVSVQSLAQLNPGLNPGVPLPAGTALLSPLYDPPGLVGTLPVSYSATSPEPAPYSGSFQSPPPGPPASPATAEVPGTGPGPVALWVEKQFNPDQKPPVAPSLAASSEACGVRLRIEDRSDTESGFFVYRLSPDQTVFQRVASVAANGGSAEAVYQEKAARGHWQYYVTAFNTGGESASNVVGVTISDPACPGGEPGAAAFKDLGPATVFGAPRLDHGRLIPPVAVDRLYIYLSLNGAPWERIPHDSSRFLDPVNGGFDAGQHLDPLVVGLPGGELSLSCEIWGWAAGKLVYLGRISKLISNPAPSSGGNLQALPGKVAAPGFWMSDGTSLRMCITGVGSCTGGTGALVTEGHLDWDKVTQETEFSWSTDSVLSTSGLWQVSLFPFGESFDPSPPGLVASGVTMGDGGKFYLDFGDISGRKKGVLWQQWEQKAPVSASTALKGGASATPTPQPSVQPRAKALPVSDGMPWSSVLGQLGSLVLGPQAPALRLPYYVRVTPMLGSVPAGKPSNSVVVHYGPAVQESSPLFQLPPPIYEIESIKFTPVQAALGSLYRCVKVVKIEPGTSLGAYSNLKVGSVVCPQPFKGGGEKPWYEQLYQFLAGLPGAPGAMIKQAADAFAAAVSVAIPGCGEVCRAALKAGLYSSVETLELYPELPSFAELVEAAKDYLVLQLAMLPDGPCALSGDLSLCMASLSGSL
jgi:LysM repeat protein